MSLRTSTWIAWSLGTLWVVLLALTFLFFTLNSLHPGVEVDPMWIEGTVAAVTLPPLGLLLASRRPEHPIGWLLCAGGLLEGLDHFCGEYSVYALQAEPGSLPAGQAAAWVTSWVYVPYTTLAFFFTVLFPDGRLPSPRWRPVAWLVGIVAMAWATVAALMPTSAMTGPRSVYPIENPLGIEGLESVRYLVLPWVDAFLYCILGLVAVVSLFLRYRRASGVERQQIKWVAYAASVIILAAIYLNFYNAVVDSLMGGSWAWWVGEGLLVAGFVGTPIAMGIAILKYRLYDIDVLINRTLVYGALTALLAAGYFATIMALEGISRLVFQAPFRALTGQNSALATIAATLAMAALFNPLRHRIQSFIDRSFYRNKYDAAKTLEAFSMKLRDETDLEALSDDLLGVVRETMQPAHVSLWLRSEKAPKGSRQTSSLPIYGKES
jgi:hypothetical protein